MKNYKIVNNLPIMDLKSELARMLNQNIIHWSRDNQICINSLPDDPDNFLAGCGSLQYAWSEETVITNDGVDKYIVKKIENPKKETDFSVLCSVFYGTLFEELYNELIKKYQIGRVRLMKSKPKTCLSWHTDSSPRIHYPIKTQEGCLMIINDEVKHLTQDTWWKADTTKPHTAINSSKEDRIHLVAVVLKKK